MIKSMTGYGKAEVTLVAGKLTVEIRTLNSKSADVSIKSSLLPKDKDLLIRQKIADKLVRGTIDVFLTFEANASENAKVVDAALVMDYYTQVQQIRSGLPGFAMGSMEGNDRMNNEILASVLRFPDVIASKKDEIITEANWPEVEAAFDAALEEVDKYRRHEGEALYKDVTGRVQNILDLENEVENFESERVEVVRERILKAAEELQVKLDKERFEQEMIFWLEKYDINEEKVRLRQHCAYFLDTIDNEPCPGKKLGFIIQEMGREINTTGSKANNASIQKLVVRMKDELEKIREQSMNIL
ncbi:MAG: YicC family protein [Bacteroidales bacterium]|nr:YicC family protein [Bacteroidales bacterium]